MLKQLLKFFVHKLIRRLVCSAITLVLMLTLAACGSTSVRHWTPASDRDTHDDPAALRPGYGSGEFGMWWPITEHSSTFNLRVAKAKAGDAQALLELAVLASADHHDANALQTIQPRIDKFVARLKPKVGTAENDLERGHLLYRAMYEDFFGGDKGELGSYELEQSRITGIFKTGRYNCISSAVLFVVLAREFHLPVRGVLVPTHAFVEFGTHNGKIVEIETTSSSGFGVTHDERFYKEVAAQWTSSRGLRPITMEEYQQRKILEPYRFMAIAMINQANQPNMPDEDRGRLVEMAALIDPESIEVQRARIQIYAVEAQALFKRDAHHSMAKMFDTTEPELEKLSAKFAADSEFMRVLRWTESLFADALQVVGRSQEAAALVDDALPTVNVNWKDSDTLRKNFLHVLNDQMLVQMTNHNYASATKVVRKHIGACRSDAMCAHNLEVVYGNWSTDSIYSGNPQAARTALEECVTVLPDNARCGYALMDFNRRYRF